MELLEGLAHKAASAPVSNDRSAVQLPPSLVGFLPLLFAEDAEHVEDHAQERRAADPARVESILLQLLASCSRTTSGGESFARCHELFGSGDVVVSHTFARTHVADANTCLARRPRHAHVHQYL